MRPDHAASAKYTGSPALLVAKRRGICIDIDPERALESKANVEAAGLADRIDVREADALDVKDLSDVSSTVVPYQHYSCQATIRRACCA
jgi:23S rRNA G2445 N2-methylase RlmL